MTVIETSEQYKVDKEFDWLSSKTKQEELDSAYKRGLNDAKLKEKIGTESIQEKR